MTAVYAAALCVHAVGMLLLRGVPAAVILFREISGDHGKLSCDTRLGQRVNSLEES